MALSHRESAYIRRKWLDSLRVYRRDEAIPADLSALADDPSPVVRLCVVGVRLAETGDVALARLAAAEAIRSGERDAVICGCRLLADLGPAAGDIVPLVWQYLRHPDDMVGGNAGFALLKCCMERRVLAEAAGLLEPGPGEGLGIATRRYVAHKLRQAAEAETGAAADRPRD
jgi:hypothetical protein